MVYVYSVQNQTYYAIRVKGNPKIQTSADGTPYQAVQTN